MNEHIGEIRYLLQGDDQNHEAGEEATWRRGDAMESPAECKQWAGIFLTYGVLKTLDSLQWAQLRRTGPGRCGFVYTGKRGALIFG